MPIGMSAPYWACDSNGEFLSINVEGNPSRGLPVFSQPLGQGPMKAITLAEGDYPAAGTYRVGLQVDDSGLGTLVFDPLRDGQKKTIPLNNVLLIEDKDG